MGGNLDITKLMLQKGAVSVDFALETAAEYGYLDVVKLLIAHGAIDFRRPLEMAQKGGHKEVVAVLQPLFDKHGM